MGGACLVRFPGFVKGAICGKLLVTHRLGDESILRPPGGANLVRFVGRAHHTRFARARRSDALAPSRLPEALEVRMCDTKSVVLSWAWPYKRTNTHRFW